MDGEASRTRRFEPLVPPVPDPVGLHAHGLELLAAANRLAIAWMRQAVAQHAAFTTRTIEDMTEHARRMAAAEDASDQTSAVLDALARSRDLGLATAQEIAGLMARMQGDTLDLIAKAVPPEVPPKR